MSLIAVHCIDSIVNEGAGFPCVNLSASDQCLYSVWRSLWYYVLLWANPAANDSSFFLILFMARRR